MKDQIVPSGPFHGGESGSIPLGSAIGFPITLFLLSILPFSPNAQERFGLHRSGGSSASERHPETRPASDASARRSHAICDYLVFAGRLAADRCAAVCLPLPDVGFWAPLRHAGRP